MEGLNANDLELAEIILECKDIRNNTVLVNDKKYLIKKRLYQIEEFLPKRRL